MDDRQRLLLEHFTEPKTIEMIAEETGLAYHTAYRTVRELLELGVLRKLPVPDGRKYRYIVTTGSKRPGYGWLSIYTAPDKEISIAELIRSTQDFDKGVVLAWRTLGGMLAHLSTRAWRKAQGTEIHPEPITVKLELIQIREFLKRALGIVEQLQYAPIWDDAGMELLKTMNVLDPDEFLELAVWWEQLWQEKRDRELGKPPKLKPV